MKDSASDGKTPLTHLGKILNGWVSAATGGGQHFLVYDSFLMTLKPNEQQQFMGLIQASEFWERGTLTANTLQEQELQAMKMLEERLAAFIRSDNCSVDHTLKAAKEEMCFELLGGLRAVRRRHELKKMPNSERTPPTLSH